jgi:hypothetical protein
MRIRVLPEEPFFCHRGNNFSYLGSGPIHSRPYRILEIVPALHPSPFNTKDDPRMRSVRRCYLRNHLRLAPELRSCRAIDGGRKYSSSHYVSIPFIWQRSLCYRIAQLLHRLDKSYGSTAQDFRVYRSVTAESDVRGELVPIV